MVAVGTGRKLNRPVSFLVLQHTGHSPKMPHRIPVSPQILHLPEPLKIPICTMVQTWHSSSQTWDHRYLLFCQTAEVPSTSQNVYYLKHIVSSISKSTVSVLQGQMVMLSYSCLPYLYGLFSHVSEALSMFLRQRNILFDIYNLFKKHRCVAFCEYSV